jgi:hypothetical protein
MEVVILRGTPAELDELRVRFGSSFFGMSAGASGEPPRAMPRHASVWTPESASRFKGSLYGNTRAVFEALEAKHGAPLTAAEALTICRYTSQRELAGTTSGITRAARSATGYKLAEALISRYGAHGYEYEIDPDLRAALA